MFHKPLFHSSHKQYTRRLWVLASHLKWLNTHCDWVKEFAASVGVDFGPTWKGKLRSAGCPVLEQINYLPCAAHLEEDQTLKSTLFLYTRTHVRSYELFCYSSMLRPIFLYSCAHRISWASLNFPPVHIHHASRKGNLAKAAMLVYHVPSQFRCAQVATTL